MLKYLLLLFLAFPVYAEGDDVARREIAHLKELIQAADKRYEQRFDAQEKAVSAALSAQEKAITKAETANEKRLDSVNEFRSQLKDQAATFITRGELFAWVVGLAGLFFAFSAWQKNRKT